MTQRATLLSIEIEAFRGFATAQEVRLDADVVLVSGGNGTGKTSLTDALAWVLTGRLPGLEARLKGERKGEDHVLNRYATGPARVRLLADLGDGPLEIERRGDALASELRIGGLDASRDGADRTLSRLLGFGDPGELDTGIHAWGILRQDAMRATLEQGSEQLHARLREILGLDLLARFELASREACTTLNRETKDARTELDDLRTRVTQAQHRVDDARKRDAERHAARAAVNARIARLASLPFEGVFLELTKSPELKDLATMGAALRELLNVFAEVRRHVDAAETELKQGPSKETVEALAKRLATAERRAREVEAAHAVSSRLAAAALELLSDQCPVCAQRIDQATVRAQLEQQLADAPTEPSTLDEARLELEDARGAVERAERLQRSATTAQERRDEALKRWRNALESSEHLTAPGAWRELSGLADARRGLEAVSQELREVYRELMQVEADPAVAAASTDLERLTAQEATLRQRVEALAQRHQSGEHLQKAATAASVEITGEALRAVEPAFAEVYDRLAPHPSFTELKMAHDVYYARGRTTPRVVDPVRGIEANPNLVCSEGQLNVIALSYFLALNLETERGGLPFAVLDDPLQSMDVINVLGFADVVRALRRRRQVVVTTHDRRFASLLERKLEPREQGITTLHLKFSAWDRLGPRIEVSEDELQHAPPLLESAA